VCSNELRECADGSFVERNPEANCLFFPCPNNAIACKNDIFECPDGTLVTREQPFCFFQACPPIVLETATTLPVAPPTIAPVTVVESAQEVTQPDNSGVSDADCFEELNVAGESGKGKGNKSSKKEAQLQEAVVAAESSSYEAGKGGKAGLRNRDRDRARGRRHRGRKLQDTGGRQGCIDSSSSARISSSSALEATEVRVQAVESSSAVWNGPGLSTLFFVLGTGALVYYMSA